MQKGFYEFRCVFMAFLFSALLFVLKDIVRGKVRAPMKMSYALCCQMRTLDENIF
jgi:hypothetical protein